jgi:hypothetical protein
VKKREIPLVVAVVSEPLSGLGMDNLLDVLFGQEQYPIAPEGGAPVDLRPRRGNDGMITRKPHGGSPFNTRLSAVLWVKGGASAIAHVLHNPNASYPLPKDILSALPNLMVLDRGECKDLVTFDGIPLQSVAP